MKKNRPTSDPTMFLQGRINNTTSEEIDHLKASYDDLGAKGLYVLTINKQPADSRLLPVPPERLETISQMFANILTHEQRRGVI